MPDNADAEALVADQFRSIAVKYIRDNKMSDSEVSHKLGVADRTAHHLLKKHQWDVSLAIRVVASLGLSVHVAEA